MAVGEAVTYKVILEWDPDRRVWVTFVPELGGISTFGETEQEALDMTKDMIRGYVEAFGNEPTSDAPPQSPRLVELAV